MSARIKTNAVVRNYNMFHKQFVVEHIQNAQKPSFQPLPSIYGCYLTLLWLINNIHPLFAYTNWPRLQSISVASVEVPNSPNSRYQGPNIWTKCTESGNMNRFITSCQLTIHHPKVSGHKL